ncbi:MAG: DUF4032 domain-containing protein [Verrucomicrobiales bacterium]|nr:DUF4032 domain-containing protein [Verrucomicrobiales bacterium]
MADYLVDAVVEKSSIYQEFLAEREEILKHKWLQSEAVGHDVGFDAALVDWALNHRSKWKQKRSSKEESH